MRKKIQEQKLEEALRAMREKEMAELELPDSLKPEQMKEKILEYERQHTDIPQGKMPSELPEEPVPGPQAENQLQPGHPEKYRKKWNRKQAGIVMSAAAAVLVLAVGAGSLRMASMNLTKNENSASQKSSGVQESKDTRNPGAAADENKPADNLLPSTDGQERREDVLSGIRKASDYEELFSIYKEAGILERREEYVESEEKPGILERIVKIFFGGSIVKEAADAGYSVGSSMAGGAALNGGAEEGMDLGEPTSPQYDYDYGNDGAAMADGASMEAPAESEESADSDYSSTNVQVEGVDESDIVKTDGTYLYRLSSRDDEITIYRTDGAEVSLVGRIPLHETPAPPTGGRYCNYRDMLLMDGYLAVLGESYEEADRVTSADYDAYGYVETETIDGLAAEGPMVSYYGWRNWNYYTELTVYDVSDPSAPKKVDTRIQEGGYQGVRMVNGIIYLVSYKSNNRWYVCKVEEEQDFFKKCYIPLVDGAMIPCDRIYLPEEPQTPNCIIITSTDIHNPGQHLDSVAILGDAAQMYVSNNNIYLWQTDWRYWTTQEEQAETTTTIMKYSYQNGMLSAGGSVRIPGYLNNSFSLDEYQGYLRVVTTREYEESAGDESRFMTENQLYVMDESMQIVGSIKELAPGEYVKSARFFGNIGYFVTFRQTDPLFSVDLSNPSDPHIIGKLKIPGFSEYLHPYGEGLLLGLGQEADEYSGGTEGVKLSMFDVSDPSNVKEVAHLMVRDADGSWSDAEYDHKAILVSPAKNLIGFTLQSGKSNGIEWIPSFEYCVFSYTEEGGFEEQITHDFLDWENFSNARGIYIGDYLYLLYESRQVAVYRLSDGSFVNLYDFR